MNEKILSQIIFEYALCRGVVSLLAWLTFLFIGSREHNLFNGTNTGLLLLLFWEQSTYSRKNKMLICLLTLVGSGFVRSLLFLDEFFITSPTFLWFGLFYLLVAVLMWRLAPVLSPFARLREKIKEDK